MKAIKENIYLNSAIFEFDLKTASLSVLKEYCGKEVYSHLEKMEKIERNIEIGKMMRDDKSLNKIITEGIEKARNQFVEENNLKSQVLEFTKDSVTIRNKIPKKLKIGNMFEFIPTTYSSYINFFDGMRNLSLYYSSLNNTIRLKGIKHSEDSPFILFLKSLVSSLENFSTNGPKMLKILRDYKNIYMEKKSLKKFNSEIYKSLRKGDKYEYNLESQTILTDAYLKNKEMFLNKQDNFEILNSLIKIVCKII